MQQQVEPGGQLVAVSQTSGLGLGGVGGPGAGGGTGGGVGGLGVFLMGYDACTRQHRGVDWKPFNNMALG